MESLVISWRELLFVFIVVLAVYAAEMLLLLRARGSKRAAPAADTQAVAGLQHELADMRQQLKGLRSDLQQLQKKSEQPATPYSQAIQLAQQGLEAADVAASCGISRGEAELIVALYRAHS